MRAILSVRPLIFTKTTELNMDYGCTVFCHEAKTPIGSYSYYKVPDEHPEFEMEVLGMYCCSGPAYGDSDDDPVLGYAEDSIKAQQLCQRDFEKRIRDSVFIDG